MKKVSHIYVLELLPGLVKVGWSRNVAQRVRQLKSLIGVTDVRVRKYRICSDRPGVTEASIHRALRQHQIGTGECFNCDFKVACKVARRHLDSICAEEGDHAS